MVIMEFDFKSLKDKIVNSPSSPSLNQKKNVVGGWGGILRSSGFIFERILLERETSL